MGRAIPVPDLWRKDVAGGLGYPCATPVKEQLVLGVHRGLVAQDLSADPIVDPHRVCYVFAVGLEAYVKGPPPGGKLDLPAKLPFTS